MFSLLSACLSSKRWVWAHDETSDVVPDCSCFDHDHVTITQHTTDRETDTLITREYCRAHTSWHSCCQVGKEGENTLFQFSRENPPWYFVLLLKLKKRHSVVNFIVCWSQFLKKFASMIQVLAFYFNFLGSENSRSFHQS